MTEQQMWQNYLNTLSPEQADGLQYTAWHFDDNEADANALADLVLTGQKRGTASSKWVFEAENEEMPQVGSLSVILDWYGNAKCIIKTVDVTITPYRDVTEQFAAREGEGDESLRYWREVHEPFFARECSRIGRSFDESMPVVCESFDVVYKA